MTALAGEAVTAREAGEGAEAVARRLTDARNALKQKYRALGSDEARVRAEQRSLGRYGAVDGPTADQLHAAGKSWDEIIAAACRPGRT